MDAQQSHLGMTDLKKRFGQQAASTGSQDLTPYWSRWSLLPLSIK